MWWPVRQAFGLPAKPGLGKQHFVLLSSLDSGMIYLWLQQHMLHQKCNWQKGSLVKCVPFGISAPLRCWNGTCSLRWGAGTPPVAPPVLMAPAAGTGQEMRVTSVICSASLLPLQRISTWWVKASTQQNWCVLPFADEHTGWIDILLSSHRNGVVRGGPATLGTGTDVPQQASGGWGELCVGQAGSWRCHRRRKHGGITPQPL